MSLGNRLGLAGIAVGFLAIAAPYLFPDQRWIGWVALVGMTVALVLWSILDTKLWVRARRTWRRILVRVFIGLLITTSFWVAWLSLKHSVFVRRFDPNVTGILVLRIDGDSGDTLQRELVSTLHSELAPDTSGQKIEVRSSEELVTESEGAKEAHYKARKIGASRRAQLVLWGTKTHEHKLFPRFTIVQLNNERKVDRDETLSVQNIPEGSLPEVMVRRPIYLAHFVAGFSYFDQGQFPLALRQFSAALSASPPNDAEAFALDFFLSLTHYTIGIGRANENAHLQAAVDILENGLKLKSPSVSPLDRALALNNLGIAQGKISEGDVMVNLERAIRSLQAALAYFNQTRNRPCAATTEANLASIYLKIPQLYVPQRSAKTISLCKDALKVFPRHESPTEWAWIKTMIAEARRDTNTLSPRDNLQRVIKAASRALIVLDSKEHARLWVYAKLVISSAYRQLARDGSTEDGKKAVDACQAALRVIPKEEYSADWARAQTALGNAYGSLWGDDAGIAKAIPAYEASLTVLTEKDFPVDWATTQNNLGVTYIDITTGDRQANLNNAIKAFNAALRVRNKEAMPFEWATTMHNLGDAYAAYPSNTEENLQTAIKSYKAALTIRSKADCPVDWAFTEYNLGNAYMNLSTGNRTENVKQARICYSNSLSIFTERGFSRMHRNTVRKLQTCDAELP